MSRVTAASARPGSTAPFSSLLAIPVRGEQSELVLVFFDEVHAFSADDLELARQVAGAARGAFQRSRLFDAERTARSLSQQLARTGSLLATKLDPVAVLDVSSARRRSWSAPTPPRSRRSRSVTSSSQLRLETALKTQSAPRSPVDAARGRRRGSVARPGGARRTRRRTSSLRAGDPFLAAGNAAYLGVPLSAPDGGLYGVLSVYGRAPRVWREEEIEALVALAANASAALTNAELYQRVALEREQSVAILANIADGIVAVDRDGDVVLWNRAAEQITGVPAAEAVGRTPARCCSGDLESEAGGTNRLVAIKRGDEEYGCRSPRR